MNEHNKMGVIANPLVIIREEFDERTILFDPETGNTFGINQIGILVWKNLDGLHSVDEIADIVCERAEAVPSDVIGHINNFVKTAVDLGLAGYEAHMKIPPSLLSQRGARMDFPASSSPLRAWPLNKDLPALQVMKTPRNVDIEITSFCNLRCTYCSHFSGPGDVKEDLPLESWLQFFAELGHSNTMKVILSGGEPFSRPDLREIIRAIVANRMRFTILSNGTLIDNEMAAFLTATRRCDLVQVSIDGAIDTTHDTFRGKGNFMKAILGIQALQANNLPVSVRVTIHRKNVHELDAIARYLLEDLKLPSFSTNAASHMGLCRKNAAQTQLTIDEHSLAMETLLSLAGKYKGRINASAGPLADAQFWLEMEDSRRESLERPAGRGFLTGCSGPMQTIAVRADGVIVPCSQLCHLSLGRINQDNLGEIWRRHPSLQSLRKRSQISLKDFPFCRDCPYTLYCTGNCPAIAYSLTGIIDHPSPDACLRQFLTQGGRLPEVTQNLG